MIDDDRFFEKECERNPRADDTAGSPTYCKKH